MEDAYSFYVLIVGIPEETFWDADISFLRNITENLSAYDTWAADELEKERQRR